jgi:hypothetical protein
MFQTNPLRMVWRRVPKLINGWREGERGEDGRVKVCGRDIVIQQHWNSSSCDVTSCGVVKPEVQSWGPFHYNSRQFWESNSL